VIELPGGNMPRRTRKEQLLEKCNRRNKGKNTAAEGSSALRFVCEDLVLTQEQAPWIASQVYGAFMILLAGKSHAIWQFEHTFNHRSTLPFCVQLHKGRAYGICQELSGVLGHRFGRVETLRNEGDYEMPNGEFISDFRRGTQLLGEGENPLVLLMLKRNQLDVRCSMEEALVSLFGDYFLRRDALPY
jgi:hypothetical protein